MVSTVAQVDAGVVLAEQAGDAITQIKETNPGQRDGRDHILRAGRAKRREQRHRHQRGAAAQMSEENHSSAMRTADAAESLAQLAGEMRATVNKFGFTYSCCIGCALRYDIHTGYINAPRTFDGQPAAR